MTGCHIGRELRTLCSVSAYNGGRDGGSTFDSSQGIHIGRNIFHKQGL